MTTRLTEPSLAADVDEGSIAAEQEAPAALALPEATHSASEPAEPSSAEAAEPEPSPPAPPKPDEPTETTTVETASVPPPPVGTSVDSLESSLSHNHDQAEPPAVADDKVDGLGDDIDLDVAQPPAATTNASETLATTAEPADNTAPITVPVTLLPASVAAVSSEEDGEVAVSTEPAPQAVSLGGATASADQEDLPRSNAVGDGLPREDADAKDGEMAVDPVQVEASVVAEPIASPVVENVSEATAPHLSSAQCTEESTPVPAAAKLDSPPAAAEKVGDIARASAAPDLDAAGTRDETTRAIDQAQSLVPKAEAVESQQQPTALPAAAPPPDSVGSPKQQDDNVRRNEAVAQTPASAAASAPAEQSSTTTGAVPTAAAASPSTNGIAAPPKRTPPVAGGGLTMPPALQTMSPKDVRKRFNSHKIACVQTLNVQLIK